ncbi:MAG: hypothetical protein HBSAPP03_19830 [Phycisphaerae bacterium]|nr:MAG: hypothetical protein HBSAPP03_19830 [Phycisphaerae bacterium]
MNVRSRAFTLLGITMSTAAMTAGFESSGPCYTIEHPVRQDAPTGCSTYTNCWNATQCVAGVVYSDCGIADCNFPRMCTKYAGGTFNPATGLCEGGMFITSWQDGVVCYHSSPIVGCHEN